MTQKTNQNPWTMDVRVRERNLKSGSLTDKDLEKFLATLPDLADQVESFATSQPALAQQQQQQQQQQHHVAAVESTPVESVAEAPAVEELEEEVAQSAPEKPQAPQELEASQEPQAPQEAQPPAVEASRNGEGELS